MAFFNLFRKNNESYSPKDNDEQEVPIQNTARAEEPLKGQKDMQFFVTEMQEYSANKLFNITTEVAPIGRAVKIPNHIPTAGGMVYTGHNGSVLYLKEAVMADHTSITYRTGNKKYFAKIYTNKALQIDLFENKAYRMIKENVDIPGVCWPIDTLKNDDGNFIGVLVPASRGVQLTRSIFNGATGLSQFFPQWNKIDLCILAYNILDKVCKMHNLGLLFGCFNPASIYIYDENEIYFVDTDSWQIEGYPVTSNNQTFTPPEIIRENKKQLLFTLDQENYQVALLTFMLMLPGKFPYAKRKNTNE